MEEKHQVAMLASIVHLVNGEWASLVEALAEMDVVRPGTNMRRVTLVSHLLSPFTKNSAVCLGELMLFLDRNLCKALHAIDM